VWVEQCLAPAQRDADAASQQQCARFVCGQCVIILFALACDAFSPDIARRKKQMLVHACIQVCRPHSRRSDTIHFVCTGFVCTETPYLCSCCDTLPTAAPALQFNQVAVSSAVRATAVASAAARSLWSYATRTRSFQCAGELLISITF
jgi:hypothetical protein